MSAVPGPIVAPRWPDAVWDAPFLRGLDARARAEIEAAGRVRALRAGDAAYKPGEPADAVLVVASGRVALVATRRGEAEASVIRRAGPREVLGEEATVVAFGTRQMEARCEEDAVVAEVPLHVLRRAIGRAGGGETAQRVERALRRAATLDLLRTTSFTRALEPRELEVLLDAAEHVHVARGAHVYREGEPSDRAYFVADGLLQAQTDDEDRPRVEAYLARGDLFGDDELEDRDARRVGVVALGPAWLVAIPRDVFVVVARNNARALEAARRVRAEGLPPRLPGGATTAHVFRDLYRMRVARSLLVIDQNACVRCGHCAWSCASVHDDGISRLVRRGDKIVVGADDAKAPLLVPNSCQHCKNPSCMIDCPTGAIGRSARGEVFIREDLCTGCGSCAKGCPWDNIQMAPRSGPKKTTFPEVAVKCDLCSALPSGPACVASCPTQAIARVDPNEAIAELRLASWGSSRWGSAPDPAGAPLPRRAAVWPWVAGAGAAALGLAFVRARPTTTGLVAGALFLVLVAYAGLKRAPRVTARFRSLPWLARAGYVAHMTIGVLASGAVAAHVGARLGAGAAAALAIATIAALATGAFGAAMHALVPARLSRLERRSVLPEELAARAREIDEGLFARLSGKSELVKTLFAKALRPYARARLGPVLLVASGRSLRREEERVRRALDALVDHRKSDRLVGVDELVRLVVEHRAVRAQRILSLLLRAWIYVHVAAAAAACVLLVAHVVGVWRSP